MLTKGRVGGGGGVVRGEFFPFRVDPFSGDWCEESKLEVTTVCDPDLKIIEVAGGLYQTKPWTSI